MLELSKLHKDKVGNLQPLQSIIKTCKSRKSWVYRFKKKCSLIEEGQKKAFKL